jgi:Rho-binding antiterminator
MSDYKPISCEFHEVLESLAMTHKNADVEYLNTGSPRFQCNK